MPDVSAVHNRLRFPPNWTQRIMTPRRPPQPSDLGKASQ